MGLVQSELPSAGRPKAFLFQSIQDFPCTLVVQAFLIRDSAIELTMNTTGHLRCELSLNLSVTKGSGNRPARTPSHGSGIHAFCPGLGRSRAHAPFRNFFAARLSPAFHKFPTIYFGHSVTPANNPKKKKNTRPSIRLTVVLPPLI